MRAVLAGLVLVACAAGAACSRAPSVVPEPRTEAGAARTAALRDPTAIYERAGLLASAGPVPFSGWVRFLAGSTPDSALALVALAFPARAFSFERQGDGYRARYDVEVEFRRGGEVVRRVKSRETVRVSSYRETLREEESVIFQQFATVPPGGYTLFVTVRDSIAGHEAGAVQGVSAPRFDSASVTAPIPVHRAEPRRSRAELPRLVANARATAVVGRDSTLRLYVERYGAAAAAPTRLLVIGDPNRLAAETTLTAARPVEVEGRVVALPVSPVDVGLARAEVAGVEGGPPRAATPVLVALGEGLVVGSLDEAIDYLRWFADPERLRAIRDTTPAARVAAWSRFLRETDPDTTTGENEALRAYVGRLEAANARFREEGIPGWLTDRGMVLTALGEPDRVHEPPLAEVGPRQRVQQWEYDALRARLVFVDRTGYGAWHLTTGSEGEFRAALRQRLQRGVP